MNYPLRAKKEKPMAKTNKSELLTALDFVGSITNEPALVSMGDYRLSVVTPYMRAYHPVKDDLRFITDLEKYHAAIKTIGDRPYVATVANTIKLQAGRFKVELPIVETEHIQPIRPDEINIPIGEYFLDALFYASIPTTPGAQMVAEAGVWLSPTQTACGTNRIVLIEAWHGNGDIFSDIIIPTDFIKVLMKMHKQGRVASHIYADDKIFAVRYADDAILVTQLYVEKYPNVAGVFEMASRANPVADNVESLKAAFNELVPFGEVLAVSAGSIDCGNASISMLNTHAYALGVKWWVMCRDIITKFDPHTLENMIVFEGPVLRGCIAKTDKHEAARAGVR